MSDRQHQIVTPAPPQVQAAQEQPPASGGLESEVEALKEELDSLYQQAQELSDDVMRTTERVGDGQ